MKKKQMLFLYNPYSGKGTIKNKLSDVIDLFVKNDYEVVVRPTQPGQDRDLYETVKNFKYPYDIVACCGGDGTINGVISGMMERHDRIPIGYIPTGTVNDFASSLHIPKQIMKAAEQIVEGYPFPCDIGTHGGETFVYVAAFGMFTDVSYATNQQLKNIFGQAAYLMEGVKRLSKLPKYHVKVSYDDQIIEDDFVVGMVTNSKSVGGFRSLIGSKVYFDDGLFEVTLVKYPRNLIELNHIAGSLVSGKLDPNHIYQFRAQKILFESWDDISWTRDGEYGGTFQKVEVENHQQAIKIMVSEDHLKSVASDKSQGSR